MDKDINIENIKNKFKLSESFWTGLFICIVAISVWVGYNYIRGSKSGDSLAIKVKFSNVYGLEKGNEVIFSGLVIGEVRSIDILGGAKSKGLKPIVTLSIEERYSDMLYQDTQFLIKSPLLVGDYWIEVSRPPGSTTENKSKLKDGQIITGNSEITTSDFAANIQDEASLLLSNLNEFSKKIYEIVEDGQVKDDIKNSFKSLSTTLDDIKKLLKNFSFDENSEIDLNKLKTSVDNIYEGSESFKRITSNLESDVENMSKKMDITLDEFSSEMKTISSEVVKISEKVNSVIDKMNEGDGTFAKLLNDPYLYDKYASIPDSLNKVAATANLLIEDINANPKKYIKWTDIIKAWRSKE